MEFDFTVLWLFTAYIYTKIYIKDNLDNWRIMDVSKISAEIKTPTLARYKGRY